ncbi:MAG: sigma-70 family RNA polymerase sigma factor [Acidimicrobiaceae bacterium]|nr:sigma-70 family RNA polymerase sigma factor [Acidimicrobiaceae bacterium]
MEQVAAAELAEMVGKAAAGDRQAWDWIVRQYGGLVWSVVRTFRLGHEQSADVVQTTWMRLVENLAALRDPCCLPAWLATTARRASINALRETSLVRPLADSAELASLDEGPETTVSRLEQIDLVRTAMARLCERDQLLLTALSVTPRIPYDEISARLGMPIGSIGPTRMRALGRLRTELESLGVDMALA